MANLTLKRFTLTEYHHLAELGIGEDNLELIDGQIVEMIAKGTAHEVCMTRIIRDLAQLVGNRAALRCQSPITFNNSEPEPTFTIVQNQSED